VQPVGPDDEIEAPARRALEGDVHSVLALGECGDRVADEDLGVGGGRALEDPGQISASELHVAAAGGAPHRRYVDPPDAPAGGVDEAHPGRAGGGLADLAYHPHALGDVHRRAGDVDRVAARAELSGA
jgi:hypothetical protein